MKPGHNGSVRRKAGGVGGAGQPPRGKLGLVGWAWQAGPGSKHPSPAWHQVTEQRQPGQLAGWQPGWDLGLGACLAAEKDTPSLPDCVFTWGGWREIWGGFKPPLGLTAAHGNPSGLRNLQTPTLPCVEGTEANLRKALCIMAPAGSAGRRGAPSTP